MRWNHGGAMLSGGVTPGLGAISGLHLMTEDVEETGKCAVNMPISAASMGTKFVWTMWG